MTDNRLYFVTVDGCQLVVFNYQIAAYMTVDSTHSEIFLENGRSFIVQYPISTIDKMITEWHNRNDNWVNEIYSSNYRKNNSTN